MGSDTQQSFLSTFLELVGSLSEVPLQKQVTEKLSIDSPGGNCVWVVLLEQGDQTRGPFHPQVFCDILRRTKVCLTYITLLRCAFVS